MIVGKITNFFKLSQKSANGLQNDKKVDLLSQRTWYRKTLWHYV